jgi:hypothetical protein
VRVIYGRLQLLEAHRTRQELEEGGWEMVSTTSGAHLRRIMDMYQELGFDVYLEEITPEEHDGCTQCYMTANETITRIYTRRKLG